MKQPTEPKVSRLGRGSSVKSTVRSRRAPITESELRAYCIGATDRGNLAGQQQFINEGTSESLHRSFGYKTPSRRTSSR